MEEEATREPTALPEMFWERIRLSLHMGSGARIYLFTLGKGYRLFPDWKVRIRGYTAMGL